MNQPEHCEGHCDETHRNVRQGQVNDEQIASCPGLTVAHNHPTDAQVADGASDDQQAKERQSFC